ncbi:hypothetical protein V502_02116 [Pseudogymnoascus sp. VKM F-4520 (FW-2644)]|nr:hypothetical protein V502_02116 [Pseudogymnoascus sp. VKM F-4520 (FW-2644)]
MPNLIVGRKRKAGHVERAVADDHYPNSSASGCIVSSPVTRALTRNTGLCGRCARLDLENIAPSQSRSANGNLVTTLSTVSTWSKTCSFCRMMSDILDRRNIQILYDTVKPHLFSYSSCRISDLGWSSINKTLLRLGGSDEYIVRQAVDVEGPIRMLKQNNIKFDILKGWISMCKDMHTKACTVEALSPNTVPFFKLIECETLRIVPAPNEPYVALSYVWGASKSQSPEPDTTPELDCLPEKLPRTIKDAITVTLKLGFRYLWVDRYCIGRRPGELQAQILKMDLIYQNAQITIIACAGENPDYGLPGKLFCGGEGIGYFPKGIGRSPWEVIERIEEYSLLSVNLRDQSDILEGILGILSAFERGTLNIRHHSGIPLLPPSPKVVGISRDNWTSAMGFFSGLCWNLKTPSTKRDGFPSWSWTGWEEPVVQWGHQKYEWDEIKVDNDIKVLVETRIGQLIDLEESYQLRSKPQPAESLSNVIQITAWVSSLRILRKISWRGKDEYKVKIKLEDGGYVYWRFKPTTSAQLLPEKMVIGIHVAYKSESNKHLEATASALLVVGKVDAIYERLGFGWVDQGHYERFDRAGKDVNETESGYDLFRSPWSLEPLGLVRSRTTIMLG